jgi:hypothetical protein
MGTIRDQERDSVDPELNQIGKAVIHRAPSELKLKIEAHQQKMKK